MLILNVGRAMGLRGIGDHYKFLLNQGFTPLAARNIMKGAAITIKFEQLERLCLVLNCTPDELFEWQPKANQTVAQSHSLNRLQNQDAQLNELPLNQVRQIIQAMRESK